MSPWQGELGPWLGSTSRSWSWLDSCAGVLLRRVGWSSDLDAEGWCLCSGGGGGACGTVDHGWPAL
jgi:hypothetical protein